jgi:hypothetical protein
MSKHDARNYVANPIENVYLRPIHLYNSPMYEEIATDDEKLIKGYIAK